jgi:hypothetical protein
MTFDRNVPRKPSLVGAQYETKLPYREAPACGGGASL